MIASDFWKKRQKISLICQIAYEFISYRALCENSGFPF